MTDVKWIKLNIGIFDDEKIKLIDAMPEKDAIFVIWIKLLTLAGKVNDGGQVYITETLPYNEEMLSTIFNRPVSIIRLAISTFVTLQMITVTENVINILNWGKHQSIDELQKMKEMNRLRQAKYRQNKGLLEENNSNVKQTLRNGIDKIRIDKSIFIVPTINEVSEYIKEKGYKVDADKFWNFYESKGWMIGKNKMRNWHSAVATWAKSDKPEESNRIILPKYGN